MYFDYFHNISHFILTFCSSYTIFFTRTQCKSSFISWHYKIMESLNKLMYKINRRKTRQLFVQKYHFIIQSLDWFWLLSLFVNQAQILSHSFRSVILLVEWRNCNNSITSHIKSLHVSCKFCSFCAIIYVCFFHIL